MDGEKFIANEPVSINANDLADFSDSDSADD